MIQDRNIGVALGKGIDQPLANAAIAAGNDDCLASKPELIVEIAHASSSPVARKHIGENVFSPRERFRRLLFQAGSDPSCAQPPHSARSTAPRIRDTNSPRQTRSY